MGSCAEQMLSDFIKDTHPNMPAARRKAAVEAMDISVVSEQYDKEVRASAGLGQVVGDLTVVG